MHHFRILRTGRSVSKWREKRRSEDAELYKPRKQLWIAIARRVDKFKHLSKILKLNIGVLIEGWNCEDDDKEDDNNLSDKEKMKKENRRNQRKWENFLSCRQKGRYKVNNETDEDDED